MTFLVIYPSYHLKHGINAIIVYNSLGGGLSTHSSLLLFQVCTLHFEQHRLSHLLQLLYSILRFRDYRIDIGSRLSNTPSQVCIIIFVTLLHSLCSCFFEQTKGRREKREKPIQTNSTDDSKARQRREMETEKEKVSSLQHYTLEKHSFTRIVRELKKTEATREESISFNDQV